jgi:hypothetical protein
MFDMFFSCIREDENVVQIYYKEVVLVEVKDMIHEVLEASRGIGEPKCHD